jgi:hypothetical protein
VAKTEYRQTYVPKGIKVSVPEIRELKDKVYFRQVHVVNGTVAWPHEQDICPDTLYLDSRRQERASIAGE